MESKIENLFEFDPYSLTQNEKDKIFYDAMNESIKFAKVILGNGPNSVAESLHCINYSAGHSLINGLDMEVESFSQLFETKETNEGLAAFVEKRKANFRP